MQHIQHPRSTSCLRKVVTTINVEPCLVTEAFVLSL